MEIIGRKREIKELESLYESEKSEFVAIYGRRRVGKTFLINELFGDRITFKHSGLSLVECEDQNIKTILDAQLNHFYRSLLIYGYNGKKRPKDWFEAFFILEKLLMSLDDGSRQIVFIDELPWLDTKGSLFITAFEGFWNSWACSRNNLMLIICGSANSWMLDKLINNHGGLYGRITYEIKLKQFDLSECKKYFEYKKISYSNYDIAEGYMILGGIPYYLNYFKTGLSLSQNIDEIIFKKTAPLKNEYDRLFESVFTSPDRIKNIIKILSKNSYGYTRKEIAQFLGEKTGGYLTENLNSLVASDFVIKYKPFMASGKEYKYKLVDQFCLFYHHFVENNFGIENFYSNNHNNQNVISWKEFAFERLCFDHIDNIKKALGISGVCSTESPYKKYGDDGVQVDMIIDRNDNVINLCEMKFYNDEVVQNKNMHLNLMKKYNTLSEIVPKRKSIQNVLITTFGLEKKEYFDDYSNVITLDELI